MNNSAARRESLISSKEKAGMMIFIEEAPVCFSLLKIIYDPAGYPHDYQYIYVNPAFERMMGFTCEQVVGRTIREVLPASFEDPFNWFAFFGAAAISEKRSEISQYSQILDKYLHLLVFSPAPGELAVFFTDYTETVLEQQNLVKLVLCAESFISSSDEPANEQKVTDLMREISGARIVTLNIYEPGHATFRFKAVSGEPDDLMIMNDLLGGQLLGGEPIPFLIHRPSIEYPFEIAEVESFETLAGDTLPQATCRAISDRFELGKVAFSRLSDQDELIGNFTMYLSAGKSLASPSLVKLLSRQASLLLIRQRAEKRINRLMNEISMIFNSTQEALFLIKVKEDGSFVYLNSNLAMQQLTGLPVKDIAGLTPYEVFGREAAMRQVSQYRRCLLENEVVSFEETLTTPGGDHNWALTLTPIMKDGESRHIVGSARDITEEKKRLRQIEFLSYHDQLTGLYNRHYFEDTLQRLESSRSLPISLLMADVNGLKLSNDVFGHAFGDSLLQRAAAIISEHCRTEDIVARVGGDEFEVVLPQTGAEEAERIAARIREAAAATQIGPVQVSMSIGCATRLFKTENIQIIRKLAEDNMYRQKTIESPQLRIKIIQIIRRKMSENPIEERHAVRCAAMCEAMGGELGMTSREKGGMRLLGSMHDLGKIILPDTIISKPTTLTEPEWDEVRRHSEVTYRILSAVNEYAVLAEYALSHHERWDGKGYPRGLAGKDIPLWSRVLAVVDAFESMTSQRPWRCPYAYDYAVTELRNMAGTQFDPELVDIFLTNVAPKFSGE